MRPIVEAGQRELRAVLDSAGAAGTPADLLPDPICDALSVNLYDRLVGLCGRALQCELGRHRPPGYELLGLLDVPPSGTHERRFYEPFVRGFAGRGLGPLFDRYPALERSSKTVVDLWVDAAVEFLLRLHRDRPALEEHFGGGESLGPVVALEAGLSDPHHGGRSIHVVWFGRGVKVVYKPRDIGIELAFSRFLHWCNERSGLLPLRALQILDRSSHGWVEYVEHAACADRAAAERLYQRAGMLLCLVYALRGTDCHYQNIVISGEHIVLVDAETMMAPPEHKGAHEWLVRPGADVLDALSYNVCSTALLPGWTFHEDGLAYDLSGLGCVPGQELPGFSFHWMDVGSDDMRLTLGPRCTEERPNGVVLDGVRLPPEPFCGLVVRGFTEMYRFLLDARSSLLCPGGPLQEFRHRPVRVLLRDTAEYGLFLQNLFAPEQLERASDVDAEFERLVRSSLYDPEGRRNGEIRQAEIRALRNLDVPCFRALSTERSLSIGVEHPVDEFFSSSGFDATLEHIQRLGCEDLGRQVALIEGAFQARSARVEATSGAECSDAGCAEAPAEAPPTPEQLLGEAHRLAGEIADRAWICADGAAHWLGLDYEPRARRFQFQVLGNCLFNGNCGIALFLAALDHVSARPRSRALVDAALWPLRRFRTEGSDRARAELARRIGIGGAAGAGALIYGLTRIGRLVSDPSLHQDARWYAGLITPESVGRDMHFHVLSGAAGAILGLLALHGETGDASLLDQAVICASHLLERPNAGVRPLLDAAGTAASGLAAIAEGELGIGLALRRLHAVAPDERYLAAADEACVSEVGLAPMALDGLCFGNFGRIDLLWEAGRTRSDARLCDAARVLAARLASCARAHGGYQLFASLPRQVFNPGLFSGIAGIGYSLLRLAAPGALPSVLLWE